MRDNENKGFSTEQQGGTEPPTSSGANAPEPPVNWNPESHFVSNQNPIGNTHTNEPEELQNVPMFDFQNSSNPGQISTSVEIKGTRFNLGKEAYDEYVRAQKIISISQICAVISLFIGGVLLSSVALGMAISASLKIRRISQNCNFSLDQNRLFMRPAIMALALCSLALFVNIVSLVLMYPIIMQAIQSGSIDSLFGGTPSSVNPSSTWG